MPGHANSGHGPHHNNHNNRRGQSSRRHTSGLVISTNPTTITSPNERTRLVHPGTSTSPTSGSPTSPSSRTHSRAASYGTVSVAGGSSSSTLVPPSPSTATSANASCATSPPTTPPMTGSVAVPKGCLAKCSKYAVPEEDEAGYADADSEGEDHGGDGRGGAPRGEQLLRSAPLKDSISRTRLYIICAGIWASNLAFAFQSTAIPTLAPSISSSFNHAELAAYLGSVFTLGNTAGIPVYGVLIDTLGRRFAMLTACTLFGAGSIACALAPGMHALIAARALAGLGGGGLLTVSAVICTDLVHLHERGFYQGIMMTIFGFGSMMGGPLSGYLADTYSWRLSFWVQVPIVLWCAFIVAVFLPSPPVAPTHRSALSGLLSLDWAGILLLLGSVAALLLGLSLHTSYFRAWSDPLVACLLVGAVLGIVAFVWTESRVKRPIVPLSMFKSRQLVAIWLSSMFLSIAAQAFLYHVPTYFAVLLDTSAARAGLVVSVCSGIGLSSGTLVAGYHIRRGGRYTWLGVLSLIPSIVSSFVAAQWTPAWPTWAYYATVLPTNVGYAIFLCVTLIALISSVDSHAMPKATALLYTVRSLGSTLGVSLGGSIQVGVLVSQLRHKFADLPAARADELVNAIVHSKAAIRALEPELRDRALDAYAVSLKAVWIAAGCTAVMTLVASGFIRQNEIPAKPTKKVRGAGKKGKRVRMAVDA